MHKTDKHQNLFRKFYSQQRRREVGATTINDLWELALSGAVTSDEIHTEIVTANLIREAALSAAMTAIESNPPRMHEVPAEQLKSETDDLLAFLRKKGHI